MTANDVVRQLQLTPHPEGGYYKETYRSEMSIQTPEGPRNVSTAIYYLLQNDDKSHFHRIKSDELWFFHQGEPLEILYFEREKLVTVLLGNNIGRGELPQATIPADTWFASHVKSGQGYSLVSCTVAPGFDFADFELAERDQLLQQYPQWRETINQFTR